MMAGTIMIVVGFLRLGTYIKYIPFPVTVGFTAGIAVIIFASQLKELFGFDLANEPAALLPKLSPSATASRRSIRPPSPFRLLAIAIIVVMRWFRPKWPGLMFAVARTAALVACSTSMLRPSAAASAASPRRYPRPSLPAFDLAKMQALLPDAATIALLGAIESLLSAVVADGLTGRKHRSNCELVAQGTANIAAVTFGGMCVTGTIARTATNIRAGAHGPSPAYCTLSISCCSCSSLRRWPPTSRSRPRRSACCRGVEHDREGGVRRSAARVLGRRCRSYGDVPAHHFRGLDHGDWRGRDARRLPVPAPHGGSRGDRRRRPIGQRRRGGHIRRATIRLRPPMR